MQAYAMRNGQIKQRDRKVRSEWKHIDSGQCKKKIACFEVWTPQKIEFKTRKIWDQCENILI